MVSIKGQKMNPNSLANLKPYEKGHPPVQQPSRGPIITPTLRKYADWTYAELLELAASPKADTLPMKEVIAITMLLKAAREVSFGDTARQQVLDRLDGRAKDVEVEVNVDVDISLTWGS